MRISSKNLQLVVLLSVCLRHELRMIGQGLHNLVLNFILFEVTNDNLWEKTREMKYFFVSFTFGWKIKKRLFEICRQIGSLSTFGELHNCTYLKTRYILWKLLYTHILYNLKVVFLHMHHTNIKIIAQKYLYFFFLEAWKSMLFILATRRTFFLNEILLMFYIFA